MKNMPELPDGYTWSMEPFRAGDMVWIRIHRSAGRAMERSAYLSYVEQTARHMASDLKKLIDLGVFDG